ncbi:hypothetical protein BDV59DRAFT_131673 [Aspergillus ambiguus]|uniref:Iwr1 domain-containing protein n=1 Tax=Aspergillus ambiguus TaxID=176160 RepID=UPI003CCD9780
MPLPPEQISIKRRREEEPPETLFIQSDLHQSKRRFTDFVFQRVQVPLSRDNGTAVVSSPSPTPRTIRSPRAVSTSFTVPRTRPQPPPPSSSTGVPLVRATSPGAEVREAKRLAAARKEADARIQRALHSSPTPNTAATPPPPAPTTATDTDTATTTTPGDASTPALRRFQISRASTPSLLRGTVGGGVQKRREGGVAVLVEKLKRTPHSRQASVVADAAAAAAAAETAAVTTPVRPRKRPVVNQAEKRWREERKTAISAAKDHLSAVLEKTQTPGEEGQDEEERLAREFEMIALEMEGGNGLEEERERSIPQVGREAGDQVVMSKPPLKYQPRSPNKPRVRAAAEDGGMPVEREGNESDDGEYVYEMYVRCPVDEHGAAGVDTTRQDIGVIVITQEDEEYWEHFVVEDEDDEDRWDSEDGDSNGEFLFAVMH